MTLLRDQTFNGLVLRNQDYRENDQLVHIFTDRFGIITFWLRGVKKAKSKQRYLALPFTYGKYQGTINSQGFSYLNDGLQVQQFTQIASDIKLNAYVTYLNDLVLRAFGAAKPQLQWFRRLTQASKLINQGLDPEIITNILEIQLLEPFGVAPNLKACVIGGETRGIFDYSIVLSGIICQKHWTADEHRLQLLPKTVAYLRLFAQVDLLRIGSIKVDHRIKGQLRQTIDAIYRDSVGIYPKSKKFIDQMYHWRI
ncbi:MAG: DNA repair protein RecO [Lactobacillus sp.]|uniref:DNA repair protein RecO n=1 Tax=Bombilactobacillus bombi TaxID=1303590 RepID=UPI0035EA74C2|nr:DNA repair protein RecO [Lactobacillus sp.]